MKFSDLKIILILLRVISLIFILVIDIIKFYPLVKILNFDDYPWGNGRKIFFEKCEWISKYYSFKYPFFYNYDGDHWHCLVSYE